MSQSTATTYITANQRLALYLRWQYEQAQQAAGYTVWETPDYLPFKNWLIRTYYALPDARLLLSEQQELVIWEEIIADTLINIDNLALLPVHTLAKTAQTAWRLLQEWQAPLSKLATGESQEVAAFYQWARRFIVRCQKENWVDFSMATEKVIAALLAGQIALSPQITLAGFVEISPQLQRLFDVLSAQCQVHFHSSAQLAKTLRRIGLDNPEIEWLAMAQWAYQQQAKNPHSLIGCVVPNLSAVRHQVTRIFTQVFAEQAEFNISSGRPFHHFPLIQTAFDILQLDISVLDMTLLSRLLASPFLGGAEQELTARAQLDLRLHQAQESKVYWRDMLTLAEKQAECVVWIAQCDQYRQHFSTMAGSQWAQAWAKCFTEQLQCMGWPGERALNSAEYQQFGRWQLLLEEFSRLDVILTKPLSRTEAVRRLHHLAQAIQFQPQTGQTAVQVLGLLEAVSLSFDALWVSGMTQGNWPGNPEPNPFIPMALQRAYNMPHATAERELAYSRILTKRFCQGATSVIFSYALNKEDQPQAPSVLIADIPEAAAAEFYQAPLNVPVISDTLEYICDDYGPELQLGEILKGGANLLKYQAACPFKAFAQLRLGAAGLPTAAFSMTPQERGVCLHAILEQVWQVLGDQKTLSQRDEATLEKFLQPIVENVLNTLVKKRAFTLKPHFMQLEQQRLIAQVKAWLEIEKRRPPFHIVALESQREIQFAGLTLKLRLDRIDELADGTRVMIDYKTGECSPANWFGERPDDPQLPLYGLTCEYPIGGLIFAQILADKLQFMGISAQNCDIVGVQPISQQKISDTMTWDAFYAQQYMTLTHLAQAFQAGHAKVDPKQPEKTCRYCDLQALCRVHEKEVSSF